MTSRIFSLEEANALIPDLETKLRELEAKKQDCDQLHDHLLMQELMGQSIEGEAGYDPGKNREHAAQILEDKIVELGEHLGALRAWGCLIRSFARGWIDFPGWYQGQSVFFCWKRGEKAIRYYHPSEAQLTERRAIDES